MLLLRSHKNNVPQLYKTYEHMNICEYIERYRYIVEDRKQVLITEGKNKRREGCNIKQSFKPKVHIFKI